MSPERGALLALEDGWHARGRLAGASGTATGEFVFNTCMSGYQEVLTDPSYTRQVVVMTYPLIGNYGITATDGESARPRVAGFVMRTCVREPSNWRAVETLPGYLERHGVVAVEGIDTRALTLHLRDRGALRGIVTSETGDVGQAVELARSIPVMEGLDLATAVMPRAAATEGRGPVTVAALDLGMKQNIVRHLDAEGCRVVRLPGEATADEVLALQPDGLFVSNGPGDPAAVRGTIRTLAEVSRRVPALPTFGICLGHQLLALAHGGQTYKLKFGHHGGNHPVQDVRTGEIDITSHNHGFAVAEERDGARRLIAGATGLEVTHVNLYDGTVEGFAHRERPLFAVQYHPEAAPGPHDALHHIRAFVATMRKGA